MKLEQSQITVQRSSEFQESSFSISEEDQSHILVILRDKLYSDKISAILREYGTNALDAHSESNIKDPIKVVLPTRFDPFLTIRDFGKGLSDDAVKTIYTKYGRSTKRDSNDAIGQLGLGCKSAFAYSQQFTVTSYYQGTVSVYNAYLDESNCGRMALMASRPMTTVEKTGVEIKIPVNTNDIPEFTTKAQKVYFFFEPQPEINCQLVKPTYLLTEGWYRFRSDVSTPTAVMGSIGYPLRAERLGELHSDIRELLNSGIEIRFHLGELSIAANREDLEYTDHTRENVKKRLVHIRRELADKINAKFAACKNVWEARMLYQQLNPNNNHYSYNRNILSSLTAQLSNFTDSVGIIHKLATNSLSIADHQTANALICRAGLNSWSKDQYNKKIEVVRTKFWYLDIATTYLQRILQNRGSFENHILITNKDFGITTLANAQKWLLAQGCEGAPLAPISSLPYDKKLVKRGSVVTVKATEKCFTLKPKFSTRASVHSTNWEAAEMDLEDGEGLYVILDRFVMEDMTLDEVHSLETQIESMGGVFPKIYGIKKAAASKIGTKWKPAKAELNNLFASMLTKCKDVDDVWCLNNENIPTDFRTWNKQDPGLNIFIKILGQKHSFINYFATAKLADTFIRSCDAIKRARLLAIKQAAKTNQELQDILAKQPNPNNLYKDLLSNYPLLEYMQPWYTNDPKLREECAHYIALVDYRRNNDTTTTND